MTEIARSRWAAKRSGPRDDARARLCQDMESTPKFDLKRDLRLRPASPGDRGYLLALEERCMRGYAEALWGQWRPRPITEIDTAKYVVIEISAQHAGCLARTVTDEQLWIDSLYIEPAFQNLGIGGYLLEQDVCRAAASGLPTRLSVLTTNPAIRFYARHGFFVEKETAERRYMLRPAGGALSAQRRPCS
ncbi:GNAT family N-acetyltransferase [Paracoccus sp. S3-43]|uniref:GNAT family N-acetyltransferase n=1 Tax=Paracoccus sp. S3-43 TaxID=3030011 RepID=UPI0023B16E0C|nr:GNAT family N-acetyltransferase [Paracoccus sp. S3-43]WEF24792.1 GNAT family N-acetyltransferase [Paracoccus sp. S3-43]